MYVHVWYGMVWYVMLCMYVCVYVWMLVCMHGQYSVFDSKVAQRGPKIPEDSPNRPQGGCLGGGGGGGVHYPVRAGFVWSGPVRAGKGSPVPAR